MRLETDYLIIGSGAVGMAFADVMLDESDADMVIVDRHHLPGGHWNDAYSFVTLHQPSTFYGVSSTELSQGRKDAVGLNAGLGELASGAEVSAYFNTVMRHRFLPSGRIRYFPMCEYRDGAFTSILSGERTEVVARRRTVDATWLKTTVPSTHTPGFEVAEGVRFGPLNDLPKLDRPPAGYVVIGGGKTGIDACLWLLENGVDPDSIRWVMPRDGWLLNRNNAQPTEEFFEPTVGALANQMEAVAKATSIDDLFDRLEAAKILLRLDPSVRPKMFHAATVSLPELEQLRRIDDVVRLGRIQRIETEQIVFDQGTLPTSPDHLHVDCSASAVGNLEPTPIFDGELIVPQTVRSYQPVFSAAFVAHIEATYDNDVDKNRLCGVVPIPNHDIDWIRGLAASMMNQAAWSQEEGLRDWLFNNRLDGMSRLIRSAPKDDAAKQAILGKMRENTMPALANIQNLLAEAAERNVQYP